RSTTAARSSLPAWDRVIREVSSESSGSTRRASQSEPLPRAPWALRAPARGWSGAGGGYPAARRRR
ncbi:MAG: hypothetical protein M0T80_02905, partial [Actinomycetota bacterium]|nr:hypothetical protein [Actinomycetota bacterium]